MELPDFEGSYMALAASDGNVDVLGTFMIALRCLYVVDVLIRVCNNLGHLP